MSCTLWTSISAGHNSRASETLVLDAAGRLKAREDARSIVANELFLVKLCGWIVVY
jgi:hypothetical protein